MLSVLEPVKLTEIEGSTMELQACRSCLATDTKLYDLHVDQLSQAFTDLTSIPVFELDGLPHRICSFCRALLLKFSAFRTRSHHAHVLLENAHVQLTTDYIQSLDRTNLNLALWTTGIQTIEMEPKKSCKLAHFDNTETYLVKTLMKTEEVIKKEIDSAKNIKEHNTEDLLDEYNDLNDFNHSSDTDDVKIDVNTIFINDLNGPCKVVNVEYPEETFSNYFRTKRSKSGSKKRNRIDKKLKRASNKHHNKRQKNSTFEDVKSKDEHVEDCIKFAKSVNCKYVVFSKEEQIQQVVARKESSNYKNGRFKCEVCYKGFGREIAFKNHMVGHDPNTGNLVCEICRLRFRTSRQFLGHKRVHKDTYVCNECGQNVRDRTKAELHKKYHSGFKYECKQCCKTFGKSTTYLSHMRIHHGSTACEICGESFIGDKGLNSHMRLSHKEALVSRCETCGVRFRSASALARHTDGPSPCQSGVRACAACGDSFATDELLNVHFELQHKLKDKTKAFKCEECNVIYKYESYLSRHWRLVHGPGGEASKRPGHGRHAARGAPGNTFVCEVCGKIFKVLANLKYHQLLHTGEKPHQCAVCPKRFRLALTLKMHMSMHTGARPFQCKYCPKAFKTYANRTVHERSHTKEKPYKCSICEKAFMTGGNLKEHVDTIHLGQARRQRNRLEEKTKTKQCRSIENK